MREHATFTVSGTMFGVDQFVEFVSEVRFLSTAVVLFHESMQFLNIQ